MENKFKYIKLRNLYLGKDKQDTVKLCVRLGAGGAIKELVIKQDNTIDIDENTLIQFVRLQDVLFPGLSRFCTDDLDDVNIGEGLIIDWIDTINDEEFLQKECQNLFTNSINSDEHKIATQQIRNDLIKLLVLNYSNMAEKENTQGNNFNR